MRIELARSPAYSTPSEAVYSKPLPSHTGESRLVSLSPSERRLQHFVSDCIFFVGNLFAFPFVSYQLVMESQILMIFLPILLPFLLISALLKAIKDIFCCGFLDKWIFPSLTLGSMTAAEKKGHIQLIQEHGHPDLPLDQQVECLHLLKCGIESLNTESDFSTRYQLLIKVRIDGKPLLLTHKWGEDPKSTLEKFLTFLKKKGEEGSQVRFTFLGVSSSYLFGLLRLFLKKEGVDYTFEKKLKEPPPDCLSWVCHHLSSFVRPPRFHKQESRWGALEDYSLWGGDSRAAAAHFLNRHLEGAHIASTQIELHGEEELVSVDF